MAAAEAEAVDGSTSIGGVAEYVRQALLPVMPPHLISLRLNHVKDLLDIEPLRLCCSALQRLELKGCTHVRNVKALGACSALTSLNLSDCNILVDIST